MTPGSLVPIIGLAIVNGMFSPALIVVFAMRALWYPFFLPASLPAVFLASSLILSTLTLMIAGVPSALYERFSGSEQTTQTSGLIWLVAVAFLTLPAIPNILKALGLG
jgi:uncharacterized protein YqgC (DUF456 family)